MLSQASPDHHDEAYVTEHACGVTCFFIVHPIVMLRHRFVPRAS